MALAKVGNNMAALFMGEIVGGLSEEITNRIRMHRGELGGPQTGPGSGTMETALDLLLDTLSQVIFLMLGVTLCDKALDTITEDISSTILFIVGLSTYTKLPDNLRKLTNLLMQDPDPIIVPNQANN
jgi:hypothetical protein